MEPVDLKNPVNVVIVIVVIVVIMVALMSLNRPCQPSYDSFTGDAHVCINGQPCNVNTQNCDVPTTTTH